ncbi:nitrate reductase molybdenum cofactor assembly chaperone [Ralstonia solanacearum]|uniref:nitrate reductase molybdenum cofactor assembly chaperone n=1 Tax=Ralstonia solanacearum TaxID=305 RepID=UPI00186861DC|nr:nitrate reductase molybdenum cofactor assembly chaperone [Ralstonia solanacearum]QOK84780.1 nitrate reductase molybdenum cofactor assembly chaperone [Ralstonia solanacearum]
MMTNAMLFRLLAAMLDYPQAELIEALPEIESRLDATPDARARLVPLLDLLRGSDLIALEENYVATFDRNPSHALYLFEHIHGESRDRGQAMVDLVDEYRKYGYEPAASELPDFVPLFLETLGMMAAAGHGDDATALLGEAIHVLAAIGERLARNGSPYAAVFDVLRTLSDVQPQPQEDPPVRDMEEAIERFGPGADGVEPLLTPRPPEVQPVHFHPRAPQPH